MRDNQAINDWERIPKPGKGTTCVQSSAKAFLGMAATCSYSKSHESRRSPKSHIWFTWGCAIPSKTKDGNHQDIEIWGFFYSNCNTLEHTTSKVTLSPLLYISQDSMNNTILQFLLSCLYLFMLDMYQNYHFYFLILCFVHALIANQS